MTVKKFGILSVGKISGILYAIMGLVFGILWAAIMSCDPSAYDIFTGTALLSDAAFWLIGIFGFTIGYGIMGFLFGLIGAALYNVFAQWIGGIKVELNPDLGGKF